MDGMSRVKKTAAIVAASITGVILMGGAAAAMAAGAVCHHRDQCRGVESDHYFEDVVSDLAATLKMSGAELESRLADGGNIMDIAAGNGVTLDDMVDSMVKVTEETLESEVREGDLSPEAAERIEEDIAEFFAWNLERGGGWLRREHAWKH